jgi:transposase InsO family protein
VSLKSYPSAIIAACTTVRVLPSRAVWKKTDQNAFIERLNRTYRNDEFDAGLFTSLEQVREVTAIWLTTCNTERPHDSLGRVPPLSFSGGRPRSWSLLISCVPDG